MVIIFRYEYLSIPILKFIEQPQKKQVVVAFMPLDGEHFTIHDQEGTPLITYSSKKKLMSSSDKMKVEIARKLRYRNPERHGQYLLHQKAMKTSNIKGYPILGRIISLVECERTNKYPNDNVVWDVPFSHAMFKFYLSTHDNPRNCDDEFRIETFLGSICMKCERVREEISLPGEDVANRLFLRFYDTYQGDQDC